MHVSICGKQLKRPTLFVGAPSSLHSKHVAKLERGVPEDNEKAVEALGASCLVKPTEPDPREAKGQIRDKSKGQCGSVSFNAS